jgi:hypothetical protein
VENTTTVGCNARKINNNNNNNNNKHFSNRLLPLTAIWLVFGLWQRRSLPVIEGSCEYIEQKVVYSRQGVAFRL